MTEKATTDGAGPNIHSLGDAAAAAAAASPGPAPAPGSEQGLVERAARGEHAAFDALVLKYQDRIYAVCLRTLRDAEAARDAAQEAFLKAWKALPRFEGRSKFSTWVHRIAVNVCLSAIRSNKAHPDRRALSLDAGSGDDDTGGGGRIAEPAAAAAAPGEGLERNETRRAVADAIAGLEPDFRTAVILRDIEGKAYDEIAEILEIPVGTVRSRIHRGREQLRTALESFVASGKSPEAPKTSSNGADPPGGES
jgi:RNA polymerase sigma-70 factor (ECF subfamily)